jgi:hypothetical protein
VNRCWRTQCDTFEPHLAGMGRRNGVLGVDWFHPYRGHARILVCSLRMPSSEVAKIASIVDLYGAQILLTPPRFPEKLAKLMNFIWVKLDFGEGHSFWLTARQFVKRTDKWVSPLLV